MQVGRFGEMEDVCCYELSYALRWLWSQDPTMSYSCSKFLMEYKVASLVGVAIISQVRGILLEVERTSKRL